MLLLHRPTFTDSNDDGDCKHLNRKLFRTTDNNVCLDRLKSQPIRPSTLVRHAIQAAEFVTAHLPPQKTQVCCLS